MNIAGLQLQKADRVFRDHPEDQPIQIGPSSLVPVFLEGLQDDPIVFNPPDELEGPVPTGLRT